MLQQFKLKWIDETQTHGWLNYGTFRSTVELQWLEHRWLVYHRYFELILESLGNIRHYYIWDNLG